MELIRIKNDELSNKLRYLFYLNNNLDYKELKLLDKIKLHLKYKRKDYKTFIKENPFKEYSNEEHYFLYDKNTPVTYITLRYLNNNTIDISLTTSLKYRLMGYAEESIKLLEEKIFSNKNIKYIEIIDLFSTGGATTKIAKKLGYKEQFKDSIEFIKENPNYIEKNIIKY